MYVDGDRVMVHWQHLVFKRGESWLENIKVLAVAKHFENVQLGFLNMFWEPLGHELVADDLLLAIGKFFYPENSRNSFFFSP